MDRSFYRICPSEQDGNNWTVLQFKHKRKDPNYDQIFWDAWEIVGYRLGKIAKPIPGTQDKYIKDQDYGYIQDGTEEYYIVHSDSIQPGNVYGIIESAFKEAVVRFYCNSGKYSPSKEDKSYNLIKMNSSSNETLGAILRANRAKAEASAAASSPKSSGEFPPAGNKVAQPSPDPALKPKDEKLIKKYALKIQELNRKKQKLKEEEDELKEKMKIHGLL